MVVQHIWPWKGLFDAGGPLLIVAFSLGIGIPFLVLAWLVEAAVMALGLKISWLRSLGYAFLANLLSTLAGLCLLLSLWIWRGRPRFQISTWWFTFAISLAVETPVWFRAIHPEDRPRSQVFRMVMLANGLSYLLGTILGIYLEAFLRIHGI